MNRNDNLRYIRGTPWSVLRHTNNLFIFYNEEYDGLRYRKDTQYEEFHVSMFVRPNGVDHHATWIYRDRYGRFGKRHHGVRFRNGRQQFKSNSRPYYLQNLFNDFERDLPYLNIPKNITRLMVSFHYNYITCW